MKRLMAGAARVKLEPPVGLSMMGYGNRVGRSTGVHDDLAAQAVVIGDGNRKFAIAGVDLLAIGKRIAADIRQSVAAKTDIAAEAILICATHTHSGPTFNLHATPRADAVHANGRDPDWERALPGRIAASIVAANDELQPATVRSAVAQFSLGTNRRLRRPDGRIQLAPNYAGVADGEAAILQVNDRNDNPIAFLLNYPCHGVVLCEDNLLYSRDWPGFAMDALEAGHAEVAARPVSIFLQGATGNIDPRSRGGFETAKREGETLAHEARKQLAAAKPIHDAAIAIRKIPITLALKDIGRELSIARECAAQTQASLDSHRGGDGYHLKRLRDQHGQSLAALSALEALEEQNRRDRRVNLERRELLTEMTLITLGDIAILGVPGELFVELGLTLKSNPYFARTFVVGYCNDLIGYIPTRQAYGEGGYEVESARVAAGAGEQIVAAALDALRETRSSNA